MKHLVMMVSGAEDGLRMTMALSLGISALAMGDDVTLFVAGDGFCWVQRDNELQETRINGFESVGNLLRELIDLGGELMVAPCTASNFEFGGQLVEGATVGSIAQAAGCAGERDTKVYVF